MHGAFGAVPDADFWIGIEGGVEHTPGHSQAFSYVCIRQRGGQFGHARSATFFLPAAITSLVRQGHGLGGATDTYFHQSNSKQQGGIIEILTAGAVDRTTHLVNTILLALIPFKNPELYR
jgi:non-canonical (house-cleaning) NTP pyrophosphatase